MQACMCMKLFLCGRHNLEPHVSARFSGQVYNTSVQVNTILCTHTLCVFMRVYHPSRALTYAYNAHMCLHTAAAASSVSPSCRSPISGWSSSGATLSSRVAVVSGTVPWRVGVKKRVLALQSTYRYRIELGLPRFGETCSRDQRC